MKNLEPIKLLAIVVIIIFVLLMAIVLSSCGYNRTIVDTKWSFDDVIIALPDGSSVTGHVESWTDYENSDMIQVTTNGTTYLTHSSNVVLIQH